MKFFYFNSNNTIIKTEYFNIFVFIIFALIVALLIISISFLFIIQNPENQKLSPYECGFEPYNDSRYQFDIKFYLIAILFIVFDIETLFLLPWCVSLSKLNNLGFWIMLDFIFELLFIYLYIWQLGVLDID
jgi:NADH-quinone oxidoreductase subunit A